MTPTRHITLFAALACLLAAGEVTAQNVDYVSESLMREVVPEANRFAAAGGDPIVREAYRGESLVGYVFLTSDLPPEQYGYSGPIETLVGVNLSGALTGVRVTNYRESYMSSMGDFLRTPGFQEQFAGKFIGDAFRVWGDVDGISRVSISVRALSRGVRNAARRVSSAYSGAVALPSGPLDDIVNLSWFELRRRGVVERIEVVEEGEGSAGISLAHISSDRVGEYLLGADLYQRALTSVERRGGGAHLMLYTVDGSRLRLFVRDGWSVVQGEHTLELDPSNILILGLPTGGVSYEEATMVGVMILDETIDMDRPFTFHYDLGRRLGSYTIEYASQEARIIIAEEEAEAATLAEAAALEAAAAETARLAAEAEVEPAAPVSANEDAGVDEAVEATPVTGDAVSGAGPTTEVAEEAAAPTVAPAEQFDFTFSEEETLLERMLANTSWGRVGLVFLVLAFATAAFFTKSTVLKWVSLGVTLVGLGFMDGGFLSISHVTSTIWVGPSVLLDDLPLLLMVTFTVVTTLLWGRIFCGFLCPFGALQDFLDRIIPKSWQRTPSKRVHQTALKAKYVILAIILIPALAGSHASYYQYFEPFGTVFFLSPSVLLWTIAGAFLLASAIIPRFYCRYACPLGAALAIGSLISLNRIHRVEQCDHCKVCEQKCPTGAIKGPVIDFKECVRCNICEVQLIEQTGVCKHDMEVIRPRLVQLSVGATAGASDV